MSQKVIFLHCPDMTRESMEKLLEELEKIDTGKYLFILSEKEIECVDKDELLRVLQK